MSTRTKYLLQGLFFLLLALLCLYGHISGQSASIKNFTLAGTIVSLFIGIVYIKNALKK